METYGGNNINKSYYKHQCSAAIEKDVIEQEIRGKDVFSRLKRWWHDLFLLSYTDSRSKDYYMSSHAIMMERKAQFRYNRGSIHPFSKFRNAWDCLILHALLIHMTLFHLTTSIIYHPHLFLYYLLVGIEYLYFLDILVNTKTGYTLKKIRHVVMNSKDIFLNYLSTNSFIHVLCAIPLQNIMFLRLGNDIDSPAKKANLLVSCLRIISIIHIVKLLNVSKYWAKDRGSFIRTVTFKFVRIIVVGLVVMIKILTLLEGTTVAYFVSTNTMDADSYLGSLIVRKYQDYTNVQEYLLFFLLISRVCKSLFLFGYSLRPNIHCIDHITAMLTYLVAFMFHFWAAVVVYNCVARESSLNDYLSTTRSQTLAVLRIRRLPDVMHTKVFKYFDFKASHLSVVEGRNGLFKALNDSLKTEMKMSCYSHLVMRIPCFSEWPLEVISEIVELLKPEIYMDGDVVSSARHHQEGLVVVEAGLLVAYSGREEVRHLVDGDHFGTPALVNDEYTGAVTIVAGSASVVLLLDKIYFRKMMLQYPQLFNELKMRITGKEKSILE